MDPLQGSPSGYLGRVSAPFRHRGAGPQALMLFCPCLARQGPSLCGHPPGPCREGAHRAHVLA